MEFQRTYSEGPKELIIRICRIHKMMIQNGILYVFEWSDLKIWLPIFATPSIVMWVYALVLCIWADMWPLLLTKYCKESAEFWGWERHLASIVLSRKLAFGKLSLYMTLTILRRLCYNGQKYQKWKLWVKSSWNLQTSLLPDKYKWRLSLML